MAKLRYTFKTDTLFKMLFVKNPGLLKKLAADFLGLQVERIGRFEIRNPEMPPEAIGDKFCHLDINMMVDGRRVDLEVQVDDEGDYGERSLYYWARSYSSALAAGLTYTELPPVVVISLLNFNLFDHDDFYTEFQILDVKRRWRLNDKMSLRYYELLKLPKTVSRDDALGLWLALFKANTTEELKWIEALEVPFMNQAIEAYHSITVTPEFKELERLRELARHNEASALHNARRKAYKEAETKWRRVVADKDTALAAALADKDAALADKDAKEAEISRLRALLAGK